MGERGHEAAGDRLAVDRRAGNRIHAHALGVDDVLGELGELLVGHEHVFLALADLHIHQLLILDGENDLVRVMQTGDKHGVVAILGLSPRRSRPQRT